MSWPEDMERFKTEYPFVYEKFQEMNRSLGKLQRAVDVLSRASDADNRLDEFAPTEGQRGPTMELD